MHEVKIKVAGMNCNHCKMNVENSLRKIEGIDMAIADVAHGEVILRGDHIDLEKVRSAVDSIGYSFEGKLD
jgi:uncharacterized protein